MITLPQLTDYSKQLIVDVPGLKKLIEVVDMDYMNKGLASIAEADNDVLFMVLPSYQDDLQDADNTGIYMTVDWFVLRKLRNKGHEAFMDSFIGTQENVIAVHDHILEVARGERDDPCGGWLRQVLTKGEIDISPVYHLKGFNGWRLTLTVPTFS